MTEYWKNRFLQTSKDIYKSDDEYVKELFNIYRETIDDLNGQISKILNSFEDMTLSEAKKMLNKAELKGFKESLKDFERKSKGLITKEIEKELQLTYKRVRISRLQAMELEFKTRISKLMTKEQKQLFAHLVNTYKSSYYHDLYELQRITGFKHIKMLSDTHVGNIVNTSWLNDGKSFSDRIWERKDKLLNTLNKDLKVALITGKSVHEMTKMISDKLEVSRSNAKRLVITESGAVHEKARIETLRRIGVERYEIVATLDLRTSKICREMDGKVFDIKDYAEGLTAPLFHVNCRSTIAPFYDDEIQDIIEGGKRIARDPVTGKSVYVDNTTYKEWYGKYVLDNKHNGYNINNNGKSKQNNAPRTKSGFVKNLADISKIKSNDDIKAFAEQLIDNLNVDRSNITVSIKNIWDNGHCVFSKNTTQNIISYNEYVLNANDRRSIKHRIKTAFHESFHLSANGMEWDGFNSQREIKEAWRSLEETFTESSAHYMLEQYGIIEKIAPAYPKELVTNLPRLKQLEKYSSCSTIQDFGKIAFTDRQNGIGPKWIELSKKMKRVKLADDYYKQYHEYIINNEDDLFDMFLENMPGFEQYRENMKVDLKTAMNKDRVFLNDNQKIVYYGILSCAMQKVGIK